MSLKQAFLDKGADDDDQEYFESLIHVDKTEYVPGPTGARAHASLARTKIARGGLGSGKSRWAGEHVNALMLKYPGARAIIARKNLGDLRDTTQTEFLEKVVSPETIAGFHVNDNDLVYKNGSKVHFRETKDPSKFKSYEIIVYLLDEADENDEKTEEVWSILDDRLRQKIVMNGQIVYPPYCGLLVFNPTDETHQLYTLANRKDIDVEDFQFSTYENVRNLPPDYIPNLLKKLAPWDVERLIFGNWGKQIRGKPMIHGFTEASNIRLLKFNPALPLIRGWDFGFNYPCASFGQYDPIRGRFFKLRELLGHQEQLKLFAPKVKEVTVALCGPNHPVEDYGDPHGEDQKDVGESSVQYLRDHEKIHVQSKRARIKTGLDEIQRMVLEDGPYGEPDEKKVERLFLVDPSCRLTIAAYMGGYARDEEGKPIKDGKFDHLVDTDRYPIVFKRNAHLAARRPKQRPRVPSNRFTAY